MTFKTTVFSLFNYVFFPFFMNMCYNLGEKFCYKKSLNIIAVSKVVLREML